MSVWILNIWCNQFLFFLALVPDLIIFFLHYYSDNCFILFNFSSLQPLIFSAQFPGKILEIPLSLFELPTTWPQRKSLHYIPMIWFHIHPFSGIMPFLCHLPIPCFPLLSTLYSFQFSASVRTSMPVLNLCPLLTMFLPPHLLIPTYTSQVISSIKP